jgi:hypothetical protein
VSAQVYGQRVLVGRPDWVLEKLPGSEGSAAAAAHLQQQLLPPEASGARLTQVCRIFWGIVFSVCYIVIYIMCGDMAFYSFVM